MNIIKIEGYEIHYPVGSHMNKAISFIEKVAFILNDPNLANKSIKLFCTGSSGAILSSLLYSKLKNKDVEVCHIKKEGETSHSGNVGFYHTDNINIIIDDFACTGDTIRRIYNHIKSLTRGKIRIDYLILSGMNLDFAKYVNETVKPINFMITQQGIDNLEKYKEEQEFLISIASLYETEDISL